MASRLRFRSTASRLEAKFIRLWLHHGGPTLEREYRFHPTRRWRSDFAHLPSRTLLEIEGGIWIRGRHNRAQGFLVDLEKYLEAALSGWQVIRLADIHLTSPIIERLVAHVAEFPSPPSHVSHRASQDSGRGIGTSPIQSPHSRKTAPIGQG